MVNIIILFSILIVLFPSRQPLHSIRGQQDTVIVDSKITLKQALEGKEIPNANKKNLTIIDVEYYSFDKKLHRGQLVVDKELAKDMREIFQLIKDKKFPIKKVVPVNKYNWSDDMSMRDNNTSAFNYRVVSGTRTFSAHALGRAIDINPFLNPHIKNDKVSPEGAKYNTNAPGTIVSGSWLVMEFKKRKWRWGGEWTTLKDYQHFEKNKTGKR